MSRPRYRLLDHTADLAYEVEGRDWPDLLRQATAALGDVIRGAGDEDAHEVQAVEVAGADREDVLVAWLNEVVIRFEDDGFLARDAEFQLATATTARGRLRGRHLDPATDPPDRVVKAVTYHDLCVHEGRGGRPWRATIVLDL